MRLVRSIPYFAGLAARQLTAKEIGKMLQENNIEPDDTEWDRPAVPAQRKGALFRLYDDYRNLIVLTVRDSYFLQRIYEIISREKRLFFLL